MTRTLFHGSDCVVETPQYGKGRVYNDYGQGFYCTEHISMAREWAVGFDHDGFANEYLLEDDGLTSIDLNASEYCTLHWLATLLQNRWFDVRSPLANEARAFLLERFSVDFSDADLIEGYRADDSYFTFAQDFISGSISYRQLKNAMSLGRLGTQVMLKSPKAFERIEFIRAEPVARSMWLPRREQRDREARRAYFDRERNARRKGDLFITDILDEDMEASDERLR